MVFGPLMYRAAAVVAQGLDPSLEEASTMLGASWFTTLRRVTLPLMMPGILAGAFLVFIQSLDNVSVSLFLADAANHGAAAAHVRADRGRARRARGGDVRDF